MNNALVVKGHVMFKVGELVKVHYAGGNSGQEFTVEHPHVGVIESIGTHHNVNDKCIYKVSGSYGCWSEDELEYLTPYEKSLRNRIVNIKDSVQAFMSEVGSNV